MRNPLSAVGGNVSESSEPLGQVCGDVADSQRHFYEEDENVVVGPISWSASARSTLSDLESLDNKTDKMMVRNSSYTKRRRKRTGSCCLGWLVPDCLKKQASFARKSASNATVSSDCCSSENARGFLYWCVTILVL